MLQQHKMRERISQVFSEALSAVPTQRFGIYRKLLQELAASPEMVANRVKCATRDPLLMARSEHNPFLSKVCIFYSRELDCEIRVNFFHSTEPSFHNHRWNLFGKLVQGDVLHEVFDIVNGGLRPVIVHEHKVGGHYWLNREFIHNLRPTTGSVSVMIREPVQSCEWLSFDKQTGEIMTRISRTSAKKVQLPLSIEACMSLAQIIHL
jgi:hypothetical protein